LQLKSFKKLPDQEVFKKNREIKIHSIEAYNRIRHEESKLELFSSTTDEFKNEIETKDNTESSLLIQAYNRNQEKMKKYKKFQRKPSNEETNLYPKTLISVEINHEIVVEGFFGSHESLLDVKNVLKNHVLKENFLSNFSYKLIRLGGRKIDEKETFLEANMVPCCKLIFLYQNRQNQQNRQNRPKDIKKDERNKSKNVMEINCIVKEKLLSLIDEIKPSKIPHKSGDKAVRESDKNVVEFDELSSSRNSVATKIRKTDDDYVDSIADKFFQ